MLSVIFEKEVACFAASLAVCHVLKSVNVIWTLIKVRESKVRCIRRMCEFLVNEFK